MPDPTQIELPAREREMIELFKQGMTYGSIAERYAVAMSTARLWMQPYITTEILVLHRQNCRRVSPLPPASVMAGLYLRGFTYDEIAKRFYISINPVYKAVKSLLTEDERKVGKLRRKQRRAIPKEASLARLQPVVRRLAQDGWTNPEIEEELGISMATLRAVLKSLDLDIRFRSKPRAAQSQCGQDSGPQVNGRQRVSEQDCRAAAERVAFKLERAYSATEYNTNRLPGDPYAGTLCRRFGNRSWRPALEYLLPGLFEQYDEVG